MSEPDELRQSDSTAASSAQSERGDSALQQAQRALEQSRQRYRELYDSAPIGYVTLTLDGKIAEINLTGAALLGTARSNFIKKSFASFVVHADRDRWNRHFTKLKNAAVQTGIEMDMRRDDGSLFAARLDSMPRNESADTTAIQMVLSDITERKKADYEKTLFQAFFSLSVDIQCIITHDRFTRVNDAFCKALGYSAEELVERPFIEFIVAEDRQKSDQELRNLLRGDMTQNFTNRYRCKNGTIRLLSWNAFSDLQNGLTYASARDITHQQAAEEQLNKLWLAVEQTSHSIVITDLGPRIEYVNQAFCDISGYTAEEVLGKNPRILQSGHTPAATYTDLWKTLGRGDIWQGEFFNRRKNGDLFIEAVRISPVRQSDGSITHYLAIKEDVTEYKRATDAIRESKVLLQSVIDSTPDWIHVKNREHRFMLVNKSFADAFNQSPEGMIGHLDTDFMSPDLLNDQTEKAHRTLHDDDDAVFQGESIHLPNDRIALANGEVRILDTFKGPLRDSSQQVYGVLCYRRDITDRFNNEQAQKALEMQLRQAQKMELIGYLTGGIAHDFNNILAAMLGYVEIIQMSPDMQGYPQLCKYLDEVLQGGLRAKELVSELLTFSHKGESATESIQIAPIMKEVTKLLRSTTPSSVKIKADLEEDLPEVLISPVQLHQILMNLGVNARDAIVGAGMIDIKADAVVLHAPGVCDSCNLDFTGRYVRISVHDNGCGIPHVNLSKIFDPFFTTKGVGHGSGLGLSVLHGIVHSANGHIEVFTVPKQGTEFRIYLPTQDLASRRRAPQPKQKKLPALRQIIGNVLLIDDEEGIVEYITVLLQNLGCTVVGMTSAPEALRLFEENPQHFDLLITDQTMPELSGAELCQAALARRPDLPIIMCSGYSNLIDEARALQIGIRHFLAKPVPAKILCDLVTELLAAKPA